MWRVVAEVAAAHVQHAASQPALGFRAIFLRDAQREVPGAAVVVPVCRCNLYAQGDVLVELMFGHSVVQIMHDADDDGERLGWQGAG